MIPFFQKSCGRLLLIVAVLLVTSQVKSSERVALIIGVDQYDHLPSQAQLKVAVDDAEKMASTLKGLDPPFSVTLLTDVEQRAAEDALADFVDDADGAECALVYFAGHGVEYHGENFLLTRDTDVKNPSADVQRMKRRMRNSALSLQTMVDELDATGAQVKVVILDACRDNPLQAEDASGTRSVFGGTRGLAQVTPPSGTLIAYSADAGQQANDGLFTAVLTEQLKKPGLPLPHVFALTREAVKKLSGDLVRKELGVYHEPAEYTKLNLAGMMFSFSPGTAESTKGEDEMEALQKQVASMKQVIEELRKAGVETEKRKKQLAKMEDADEEAETKAPVLRKIRPILPKGSQSSAVMHTMEGGRAGEVREFGGIEMIWCPPGEFLMGSPEDEEDRSDDEKQHRVTLAKGFWMAKTECTQSQWQSVMGDNPSEFKGTGRPVETVSWDDCQEWLARMNREHPLPEGWKWVLPSEAQWEYACRAGTETAYVFGNDNGKLHQYANFADKNFTKYDWGDKTQDDGVGNETAEVGTYVPNGWGLHDMHGNVLEWSADYYDEDYYSDGQRDREAPDVGSDRVLRGGGWFFYGHFCRSANRGGSSADLRSNFLGLRPAVSSKP